MAPRTETLDLPPCPLCGVHQSARRFSDRDYDVRQCGVCELFFIDPYPTDQAAVHDTVTDYDYEDLDVIDPERHYRASQYTYRRIYPIINEQARSAASVLDVGCGSGYLLELLSEHPHLVRVGIELNAARAAYVRRVAKCEVFQQPIEQFQSNSRFDLITFINVFSHVPAFDALFQSFHALLSENGRLIIKAGEMSPDVQKSAVFDWGIPGHLHFLGLNTMSFIADKYGFEIVRHQRVPRAHELFSRERWLAPGRSTTRNVVKQVAAHTPYALTLLANRYERKYGSSIFSSLFVLVPRGANPFARDNSLSATPK